MASPSELHMFNGDGDVKKFFYIYENVVQKGKTVAEKAENIVLYLTGSAFDFYFDTFTIDNSPTEAAMNYNEVKLLMIERFSPKKAESTVMREAITFHYDCGDIKTFLRSADKLYKEANFNEATKFGLLRESLKTDQTLLQFVLLRGCRTYQTMQSACLEYAENQKVLYPTAPYPVKDVTRQATSDSKIDMLCKQMTDLSLMIQKSAKPSSSDRPCHIRKKTGHFSSRCEMNPERTPKCDYCHRHGHSVLSCYTKQRDEEKTKVILRRDEQPKEPDTKPEDTMVTFESVPEEENVVAFKRNADGEPFPKQSRTEGNQDIPMTTPGLVSRTPFCRKKNKKTQSKPKKSKSSSTRLVSQEIAKRVEKYNLINSLAQAPAGITFGQIARGDVDNARIELQKILSGRMKKSSLNFVSENAPNRHQVVRLTLYSESVYALLDSGAIPNVMSREMAERLNVTPQSTARRIKVANGSVEECLGVVSDVPVGFGDITVPLNFLVIEKSPYNVIIGAPVLVTLRTRMDMYRQIVKIQYEGKTETLSLQYEPNDDGSSDEHEFTSDSDTDSESDDDEFVLMADHNLNGQPVLDRNDIEEKISHLCGADANNLRTILTNHHQVIAKSLDDLRPSDVPTTHSFSLTNDNPIYHKCRRMAPAHNQIVREEINRMLDAGIITPASSSWSFPVVIATKKDGKPRFCWPLPRVDEVLEDLSGSCVFSTLELFSGYWQIRMEESCKEKTTFVCKDGTYRFEVMPCGLMNAPATFQRMMDQIFRDMKFVKVYLDDVVIHSSCIVDHFDHLIKVMTVLSAHGLRVKLSKCFFAQNQVKLFGHIVDSEGIHVDMDKVSIIQNSSPPTSRRELRSFLGLASYYRRFIKGFAKISKPFAERTSERMTFEWTQEMDNAFKELKSLLCKPPVLSYPDHAKPFIVHTGASSKAIGAVLSQKDDNGREHPIHFASRTLSSAECNYSTFEREALAVIFALKKFRPYLLSAKFTLFTDHHSLKYVFNQKDPHGRISRWLCFLADYDFEIQYRPGKDNSNADYCSRPVSEPEVILIMELEQSLQAVAKYLSTFDSNADEIGSVSASRDIKQKAKNYMLHDDVMFRRTSKGLRYIPPEPLRPGIMEGLHDELGHWDFTSTYSLIADRFWWPSIRRDVSFFVRSCDACQKVKNRRKYPHLSRIPVSGLFHTWSVDFAGPLPKTKKGNRFLLIAVEHLSGWPVAIKVPSTLSTDVTKFIQDEICRPFGSPVNILSDNASYFRSEFTQDFASAQNIKWKFIAGYSPQSNGKAERMVGTIKRSIKKVMIQTGKEWDECLDDVLIGYRRRPGADGKSPFEVLYGIKLRFSTEFASAISSSRNSEVVRTLELALSMSTRAVRIVSPAAPLPSLFNVGDQVLLRRGPEPKGPKIKSRMWEGPFVVSHENHPRYTLRSSSGKVTRHPVHARRLMFYTSRTSEF